MTALTKGLEGMPARKKAAAKWITVAKE